MKKQITLATLIAMVSAAGVVHAQDSTDTTTLYGRIGYGFKFDDKRDANNRKNKTKFDLKENGIRLGVKGNEGLASGLNAIYQLEFAYNTDTNDGAMTEIRQAWVGLAGDFGTLKFGKQNNLRDAFFGKTDQFQEVSGTYQTYKRTAKTVSYMTSKQFADDYGLQLGFAGILDGNNGFATPDRVTPTSDSRNFSMGQVGAQYTWNGITAATTYTYVDGDVGNPRGKQESITGSLSYGDKDDVGLYAAFDYEHASSRANMYALLAQYRLDETNTFRLGFEAFDPTTKGQKTVYRTLLGYQYNFSKRTLAWVEGAYQKNDASGSRKSFYEAVVGLRHNF